MKKFIKNVTIENAHIFWRHFGGGKYGRSVCVEIPEEMVDEMIRDGWAVKKLEPREEGDNVLYYISAAVKYGKISPSIYLIAGKNKTLLTEEMIGQLDYAEVANCDIILTPYIWDDNGVDKVKAYLKTAYITVVIDDLSEKYAYLDEEAPF